MRIGFLKALAISGVLSAAGALPAQAALIGTFDGNDCAGDFGQSFGDCRVPEELSGVEGGTPVIIKFDFDENGNVSAVSINSDLFPSIDGDEFSWDFGGDGNTGTGTWTYVKGDGDPNISVFVAKGGNAYNLFSTLGDYTDVVYFTPNNPSGSPAGLSHLTFYDTDGDDNTAPEPGTLALIGLGLLGVGLGRRRRH